ncbi:MAG TPA: alpha/beta hydrolase-fold protein, partial [Flavitalea sp.]|nr:alpha/beta hydrolase-fold protein [Flavitalea sp.]
MKSIYCFFIFSCAFASFSQTVRESLSIPSRILGREVKYSIYIPKGYDNSSRRFPVLYLLHGYSDNEMGWTQFGEVEDIANNTIEKGEATPMLIAMPDAAVTWYINDVGGKNRYEDFFIQEFIPFIDSMYRTR